jgi:hypothetical protein
MPTVLRVGRYRFFFYSNEGQEPPHIHVEAAENGAKFWLAPISLASNHGFRGRDLSEIMRLSYSRRGMATSVSNAIKARRS